MPAIVKRIFFEVSVEGASVDDGLVVVVTSVEQLRLVHQVLYKIDTMLHCRGSQDVQLQ